VPLDEISFVFHNSDEPGPCISKPPLADISSVNVAHYCNSADLENGLHICGVPTPIAIGFGEKAALYLGARNAWASNNPEAKAMFLEFTGQGLSALKQAMDDKAGMMAALGARLVEPRNKDAEALETVQLRAAAETSTLARVGLLTSEGLSEVLQWAAWWDGTKEKRSDYLEEAYLTLNQDYVSARLTPEELTGLMSAWQQGAISDKTLFFNYMRGEVYEPGTTIEEEQARIESHPAVPPLAVYSAENEAALAGLPPPKKPGEPAAGGPPPKKKPPAKK
jgi:hypothetical protein